MKDKNVKYPDYATATGHGLAWGDIRITICHIVENNHAMFDIKTKKGSIALIINATGEIEIHNYNPKKKNWLKVMNNFTYSNGKIILHPYKENSKTETLEDL